MELPDLITAFVKAQNNHDSTAHVACFSEDAIVFDEGKNHLGRNQIKTWIEQANEKYQTAMEPINYSGSGETAVLIARISGTFEGSPILLNYQFGFADDLIQTLKIAD